MKLPQITTNVNIAIQSSLNAETIIITPELISPEKWNLDLGYGQINKKLVQPTLDIQLQDFPETAFPEQLTTQVLTSFEENLLLRDNEWKSPHRFLCEILWRQNNQASWIRRGLISILNRGGAPYPHPGLNRALKAYQNEVALEQSAQLALKLIDIGAGLLRGNDKIIFSADYHELAEYPDSAIPLRNSENKLWAVNSNPLLLLNITFSMAIIRLTNTGTNTLWINYGQISGIGYGDPLYPTNTIEIVNLITEPYNLLGNLYAIAESGSGIISGVIIYK